ncbi:hypothetical protein LIPSTDRAFT_221134 [Lipomyces starkeyi NRRL Y-11557]|uniref:Uncharacterized protein n=1 Tax=Lipomyces starkeyi NRRL Y-11557 TaxID=675824 RepID=A0A1E3QEH3_LIPST|nr:hypothetical protein LIPSTDRAFT_221134 [Lipomyces starkeyi NRRL Y-11557]
MGVFGTVPGWCRLRSPFSFGVLSRCSFSLHPPSSLPDFLLLLWLCQVHRASWWCLHPISFSSFSPSPLAPLSPLSHLSSNHSYCAPLLRLFHRRSSSSVVSLFVAPPERLVRSSRSPSRFVAIHFGSVLARNFLVNVCHHVFLQSTLSTSILHGPGFHDS